VSHELEGADLDQLSEKGLRKQLEAHFRCDLKEKKEVIREEIFRSLQARQGQAANEDADGAPQPKRPKVEGNTSGLADVLDKGNRPLPPAKPKRSTGLSAIQLLSPALSDFLGFTELPRTEVVKKIWEYVKQNELQNPSDKREIILDGKLKAVFKGRRTLSMFTMNKVLSRHLHKKDDTVNPDELWKGLDEVEEVDEEEEKARMKLKLQETRKLNKEKKLKKKKKQKRTRRPGTGGLSVMMILSDSLASLTGAKEMPRTEVVKFLWAHIKANKLQQNPNDGREITCDEKMQEIFGQPTVTMLQMNKVRASKNMQKASAWWAVWS